MRKTEFIEVMEAHAEQYGEVVIQNIVRPNVTYTGLMIKKEAGIPSPVVDLDWLYELFENGKITLEQCYEQMDEILSSKPEGFNASDILDWEKAKDKLFLRVFGKKPEKPEGYYREIEDLYLVPYVQVTSDDTAVARVVSTLLDKWEVDEDIVFDYAKLNQETLRPGKIVSMAEQLGMTGEIPMYIVSTESGINGASAIFYDGICEEIREKLGDDFYIIPSSIHEVITVPKSMSPNISRLKAMVECVNATEVKEEDRLTNSVYTYDFDLKKIVKVG